MSNPMQLPPEALAALAQAAMPKNPRDMLPTRAAGSRMYTVAEAKQLVTNIGQALHRTSRLPITVDITEDSDGSLVLRVTPA